ncbi:MAG: hypothetical protein U9Q63_03920 [Patescibacteria group bacterium]|nr:hypothetical protein [Patescibacteria group bacterium]
MISERLLSLTLVVALSLYYSTLGRFNFLWLMIIWLAVKREWLMIFFSGLIFDLIIGTTLGLSSLKFLGAGILVYLIKEYWPIRIKKQLKLKI